MITTTTPSKLAVVFAGQDFTAVELLDGKLTPVRVRSMPARHLSKVLEACTNEAALLELTCLIPVPEGETAETEIAGWMRVPPGWVDNLTDVSHVALLEAAKSLNFSRAAAWGERQIAAKQFQAPILLKTDKALMPMVQELASLILSQTQSASRAAPSTKS
jgi:hypothetical protein